MTGLALNYCGSEAVVTLNDGCVFRLDISSAGIASNTGNAADTHSDDEIVPTIGSLQHFTGHRNCQTFKQVRWLYLRSLQCMCVCVELLMSVNV